MQKNVTYVTFFCIMVVLVSLSLGEIEYLFQSEEGNEGEPNGKSET
jgi:hypothetical protein